MKKYNTKRQLKEQSNPPFPALLKGEKQSNPPFPPLLKWDRKISPFEKGGLRGISLVFQQASKLYPVSFTIFILLLAVISSPESIAQDKYAIGLGPSLSMKAGINGVVTPKGRKNGISFNSLPDFGLTCLAPISRESNLGVAIDMGYSSFSYIIKSVNTGEKYTHKFDYLTFSPMLYFEGLLLGFGFGYPISGSFGADIASDKIGTMVEFRLGGMFNLVTSPTGSLNIFIKAGYMLTGIFKDFETDDPLKGIVPAEPPEVIGSNFNPRAASLQIGFTYLFDIPIMSQ